MIRVYIQVYESLSNSFGQVHRQSLVSWLTNLKSGYQCGYTYERFVRWLRNLSSILRPCQDTCQVHIYRYILNKMFVSFCLFVWGCVKISWIVALRGCSWQGRKAHDNPIKREKDLWQSNQGVNFKIFAKIRKVAILLYFTFLSFSALHLD